MSNQELNGLDDFERFVSSTIKPWSREQRISLAASMAERWLPAYESFCEEEEYGDPSIFQLAVDSVWSCALGHKLKRKDQQHHKKLVEENTPHLDDYDAEEAIAASAMIDYALECCASADNTDNAVMAMVSGFEAVAPGIYSDGDELPEDFFEGPEIGALKNAVKTAIDNEPAVENEDMDTFRQQLMSLRAASQDGIGPLPSNVWDAPQIRDQMERALKLRKVLSNPDLAQFFEPLRQKLASQEPSPEAQQAAQDRWRLPQVQDELKKQLKLLKLIGDMTHIDQEQIDALRQKLTSPELVGSLRT